MDLYESLLESDLPDDDYLIDDLVRYFPSPLQSQFRDRILAHRLRREIIATSVTNSIVNRVGMSFVDRLADETGLAPTDVARAYAVVREAFNLREIWTAIEALDNKVPTETQTDMLMETGLLIDRVTSWFLRNVKPPLAIEETIHAFKPAIAALSDKLMVLVGKARKGSIDRAAQRFVKQGVPKDLALTVARLRTLGAACDIVETARVLNLDVIDVGTVFFDVGEQFGTHWLRDNVTRLTIEDRWDRLASQALVEDSFVQQRALTAPDLAVGERRQGEQSRRCLDCRQPIPGDALELSDERPEDRRHCRSRHADGGQPFVEGADRRVSDKTQTSPERPRTGRLSLYSWCLFDWANSPVPTVVITFVFAAYFARGIVGDQVEGTALWSWGLAASAIIVAVLSPIVGAIADAGGRRKPWIFFFTFITLVSTTLLWFAEP